MKIVIAGGATESEFLAEMLIRKGHTTVLINEDKNFCDLMASKFKELMVIIGDPRNLSVLFEAEIEGFDIMISLCSEDADNLSICQMGKKMLGIEKNLCSVTNPKNVQIFAKLGVDHVVSSAYLIAEMLKNAAVLENMIQALPIEEGKIVLGEIIVSQESPAANKYVKEIKEIPEDSIISCVIRDSGIIIPKGNTMILPGDKLIMLSSSKAAEASELALSGRK